MGLRVSAQDERMGLDLSQPSESAYVLAYDYDEGPSSMPIHHSSEERGDIHNVDRDAKGQSFRTALVSVQPN